MFVIALLSGYIVFMIYSLVGALRFTLLLISLFTYSYFTMPAVQ